MFDLEKSIQNWLGQFSKHRAFDEGSLMEMELHLRDHVEDLISAGASEEEAFQEATASFGEIPTMANEDFSNQQRKRTLSTILYSTLFKNYYKTTWRSMLRNPMSSFINVIGLAAAIGICIFTYSFAQWTHRTDQFHQRKHEVFLATFFANRDGKLQQNGRSPRPLAEALIQDFPQVKAFCRIQNANAVVKQNANVFHERITYADPSFLSLFTFPLKKGHPSSLKDVNSIILSEEKAIKYFGDNDPIGETLLVKFDKDTKKTFIVTGVAEEFPTSHSLDFHFLLHIDNLETADADYDKSDWNSFVEATFVQVKDTARIREISQQMEKYKELQNEAKKDWQIESFQFEPLASLHQRAANIRNSIVRSSEENYTSIIFLAFVGVFMLALACFNYINIAIVSATKRLKEIGIRKTIGASRRTIILQFLSENIVATSFALALGVLLGSLLFIPWFESLFDFDMGFKWTDTALWVYLAMVLFITALASGLYPAFYISKFPVTGILKGALKFRTKNPLTRVILGFQLVLACMFITCAIMFTQNSSYLANRSWGYREDLVLYAEIPDLSSFRQLEAVLAQNPDVLSISGSSDHLGRSSSSVIVGLPDSEHEAEQIAVDPSYFETLGIVLNKGRGFIESADADKHNIVINKQFQRTILPEDPIGKTVRVQDEKYTVIGITKDFHAYSFDEVVKPTFFSLAKPEAYQYLSVKVAEGKQKEVYRAIQSSWVELFPEIPFPGGYQEDVWGSYFMAIGTHGKVWRGIALIAILLAGLGLYGLVSLNVSGRVKELSIRKVLGAGIGNISKTISKQYVFLFSISLGLGAPLSYFLVTAIIDFAYTYHMPPNAAGVVLALLILTVVLGMVLASQLLKVSKSNPVNGLNEE